MNIFSHFPFRSCSLLRELTCCQALSTVCGLLWWYVRQGSWTGTNNYILKTGQAQEKRKRVQRYLYLYNYLHICCTLWWSKGGYRCCCHQRWVCVLPQVCWVVLVCACLILVVVVVVVGFVFLVLFPFNKFLIASWFRPHPCLWLCSRKGCAGTKFLSTAREAVVGAPWGPCALVAITWESRK